MATGLAGGVGSSHQELCGALSAGVMVIGGRHGRADLGQDDQVALELAARYRERFLRELGSTLCDPLRQRVKAPGGLGSCTGLVEQAAYILLDLLEPDSR
jgi:C_GCAxxG_C_C family probable redox protein